MRNLSKIVFLIFFCFCLFVSSAVSKWEMMNPKPHVNHLACVKFYSENIGWTVGDYGLILKTTDGGNNWEIQNSPSKSFLKSISIINEKTLWVAGSYGGVLLTTDGGKEWKIIETNVTTNFRDLNFLDEQTGYVVGESGIILKTTNGGQSWENQLIPVININGVFFTNANKGWAVGKYNNNFDRFFIMQTTNGGKNWILNDTSYGYNSYINNELMDVQFLNDSVGYVMNQMGHIRRTSDAGKTWEYRSILNSRYGDIMKNIVFLNDSNGWAIGNKMGSYNDSCVYKTTNGGKSWTQFKGNYVSGNSIFFINKDIGWAVFDNCIILKTTNGGETWKRTDSTSHLNINTIWFKNNNEGFAFGNVYLKTTNGGKSWSSLDSFPKNACIKMVSLDSNTFFVLTSKQKYFKTTDSWKTFYYDTISYTNMFSDVCFANNKIGWVIGVTPYAVWKTTDGGESFTKQDMKCVDDYDNLVSIFCLNENICWISTKWGLCVKTTNGGKLWDTAGSITWGVPVRSLFFQNENLGWAVDDVGNISKTTDGGFNWESKNSGYILRLNKIYFKDSLNGWIVNEYGGGIVKTTDGGDRWIIESTYITPSLNSIFASGENVWVAGGGGAILKYTKDVISVDYDKWKEIPQNNIGVSPNPASDYITLNIPPLEKRGLGGVLQEIKIFNIYGKCVLSVETQNFASLHRIDISSLPAGVYFVGIGCYVSKFVKK
jgi:photosystem II stability/assembly factor-like uncharacterized protein